MKTTHALTTLALAGALMLTGCSSSSGAQDPEAPSKTPTATTTTASPTPSPTPTQSQEDISIAEVKQTYKDYLAAGDAAGAAGYSIESIDKVLSYLTADGSERLSIAPQLNTAAEQGITTQGKTKIGSLTATSYTPGTKADGVDDLGATVVLDACADPTGKKWFHNGEPMEANGLEASCTEITFVNQGTWLIDSSKTTAEEYH